MLVFINISYCQTIQKPDSSKTFYIENKPEFPGGEDSMLKYIANNIIYPITAKENRIQGKVYIGFLITETGNIDSIKVLRGVDNDLDNEAIRVIKNMPKWKPATFKGKNVISHFQLPIKFLIN